MSRWLTPVAILFCVSFASAQSNIFPLTSNQWVQPTQSGQLIGRMIVLQDNGTALAVEGAEVTIRRIDAANRARTRATSGVINTQSVQGSIRPSSTNRVVHRAVTDADGRFSVSGVEQGVYAATLRAERASAHLALHVIDSDKDLQGAFPSVAEISAVPMPYGEFRSIVERYRTPINRRTVSMSTADLEALSGHTINQETYRVSQFDDGLNGRIYAAGGYGRSLKPSRMTNVLIIRNGVEVGRDITNDAGDFRVDNLAEGIYSLVAVGPDGIASIGFELASPNNQTASNQTSDGQQLVSRTLAHDAFRCQVAPWRGDGTEEDEDEVEEFDEFADGYPIGGMYGGFGGGGFGGGGGGGGGGGIGGIGALAGLAGLAGAASGGSGGGGIVSPPAATPSEP